MSTFRSVGLILVVLWSNYSFAQQPPAELLKSMVGTWDVQQRMWSGPGAEAMNLPRATAQRRLVQDLYLEEVMQPVAGSDAFSRNAFFNYNAVSKQYEYTSLDTRAPQLMTEKSQPAAARTPELKLAGSSFTAPDWGGNKNVRFTYRLTIAAVKDNQQVVRLFLTPQTVLPKAEFLAFEYVYTKKP